jgi:hypothetical protein
MAKQEVLHGMKRVGRLLLVGGGSVMRSEYFFRVRRFRLGGRGGMVRKRLIYLCVVLGDIMLMGKQSYRLSV